MQATAETSPTVTVAVDKPAGGLLRCDWNRLAGSPQSKARVFDDIAEQGARRLGTLALLTAASVVASVVIKHLLQAELAAAQATPLFRLSMLFLMLASIGLAALQRFGAVSPQVLLDLGLVFEVAGAFSIAAMENAFAWATLRSADPHLLRHGSRCAPS